MFERIDYIRLRELLDVGGQLVEVLPPEECAEVLAAPTFEPALAGRQPRAYARRVPG